MRFSISPLRTFCGIMKLSFPKNPSSSCFFEFEAPKTDLSERPIERDDGLETSSDFTLAADELNKFFIDSKEKRLHKDISCWYFCSGNPTTCHIMMIET